MKTFLTDPAPGVSPKPQPSEIELCLKESETSASQSIVFSILIGLRSITSLKAQLDSDLPEAASGIRRRLCSPVPRVRQLRAAPGCAGLRIRALRGCLGRPQWTLLGSPKWFCFRYLVKCFLTFSRRPLGRVRHDRGGRGPEGAKPPGPGGRPRRALDSQLEAGRR